MFAATETVKVADLAVLYVALFPSVAAPPLVVRLAKSKDVNAVHVPAVNDVTVVPV